MFQELEENTFLKYKLKPSPLQEEENSQGQTPLFIGQYYYLWTTGCSSVQLNTVIGSNHAEQLHHITFSTLVLYLH